MVNMLFSLYNFHESWAKVKIKNSTIIFFTGGIIIDNRKITLLGNVETFSK